MALSKPREFFETYGIVQPLEVVPIPEKTPEEIEKEKKEAAKGKKGKKGKKTPEPVYEEKEPEYIVPEWKCYHIYSFN